MRTNSPNAVADFCETLRRLVHGCGVPQADLARALHRAESTVSELLSGRRTTPPRLDLVLDIVRYCRGRAGENRPPGVSLDPDWWRTRYAELEHAADTPRPSPPVAATTEPPVWLEDERLGFADAVGILRPDRAGKSRLIEGLLAPLTLSGSASEVVRDLFEGYPERVRAAHGTARTALLRAADVVVHVAAFCEAVRSSGIAPGPEWGTGAADLTTEVLGELGQVDLGSARFRDPRELRNEITASYRAADELVHRVGDAADPTSGGLAQQAIRNYDRLLAPLTWACPELRLTSETSPGTEEDQAPHEGTGLARLDELLTGFAGGGKAPARHSTWLRRPITSLEGTGTVLPTLAEGYVDPSFRLAPHPVDRDLASDEWWERQPLLDDLGTFLATHLLTSRAVRSPLLVLGHPGSGKSLLTRLIAARLPENEFFCVRVELRHVPADTDVQEQIEAELLRTTGRRTPWPDAVASGAGLSRVVLLDGFDELLQAGAHHLDARRQWSYLRDIELFQEREADWGRPTIVIVTSRTVVADRVHTPAATTVLRLEPFDDARIDRWLATWERLNDRARPLRAGSLTLDALASHRDLARQPLLLLMLALYDATGGPVRQEHGEGMKRVELYERLLHEFVRREVVRRRSPMPPSEEEQAVEKELLLLGAVAMGMFNRRSQSIMAKDVEHDLAALLGERDSPLLFGRFFFVHESQAVAAEEEIRSYEFLHATFGEYLVARLVGRELGRVVAPSRDGENEGGAVPKDDRLRVLLSAVPLTDRVEVLRDMAELLRQDSDGHDRLLIGTLRELFARTLNGAGARSDPPYRPLPPSRLERDAVYGANLLLLAVLCTGGEGLTASAFLSADAPVERWWRCAHLWRSQLGGTSWNALAHSFVLRQRFSDGEVVPRDLHISLRDGTYPDGERDHAPSPWRRGPRALRTGLGLNADETARRIAFLGDVPAGHLMQAVLPLLERLPGTFETCHVDPGGGARSTAHALLNLVCRVDEHPDALSTMYEEVVSALHRLPDDTVARMTDLLARHLALDASRLPGATVLTVLKTLTTPVPGRPTPDVAAGTWQALLHCVEKQSWRTDVPPGDLERIAASLGLLLAREGSGRRGRGGDAAMPELKAALSGSGSTRLWHATLSGWSSVEQLLDAVQRTADRIPGPARDPEAIVGALRLARETGRTDWLFECAEPLLRTLPLEALGLLLPSDVDFLRPLVRDATLLNVFVRIEEVWRGGRTNEGRK
ncbi:helix-turn-helix domain-containing protein [Streptomyces sp. NPDC090135]|uniref:NACHT N-terminal helical domain 7-containing protein n=1 Tax=Streptomyces sp. NPDC090135 TaxID=3365957 RepID=UPI0038208A6F